MKFPLSERPFTLPVVLSEELCVNYAALVETMLFATVREYDHFHRANSGQLSKKAWKPIKHREALTVYRKRSHADQDAPLAPSCSAVASFDWSLPRLLMTGAVVGSLDDVMFGSIATTSEAMRIRSAYVQDEVLDCEVLREIKMPSADAPFQFLGLKWAVRNHSSTLNPMIWPRDTVFVEGTGIHTQPDGTRLGYRVVHSVQLSQCPELTELGMVRTRMSSTSIFKQLPNGTVDVFMTRFVESSGNLPDSVTLNAAAASMIGCWKSVWCSQNKKLAVAAKDGALRWEVEGTSRIERLVLTTDEEGRYCCGLCLKGYKLYNSVITCQSCNLMVCSRCQVGRRLARIGYQNQITQHPVLFCKNCIALSTLESAWEVASGECTTAEQTRQLDENPRPRGQTATIQRENPMAMSSDFDPMATIHEGSKRKPGAMFRDVSLTTNSTFADSLDGMETHSFLTNLELDEEDDDGPASGWDYVQTLDDWNRELHESFHSQRWPRISVDDALVTSDHGSSSHSIDSSGSSGDIADPQQQQLWKQMSQLCMAAEETHRLAMKNAEAMRHQQQQPTY